MHRLFGCLLVLLAPALCPAQPAGNAGPQAAAAAAIAPWTDDATLAVLRIDMRRTDPAVAIAEFIASADRLIKAENAKPSLGDFRKAMEEGKKSASDWRNDFLKSGGTEIYFCFRIPPDGKGEPVMLVAPLPAGADADHLQQLLAPISSGSPDQMVKVAGAVVSGSPSQRMGFPLSQPTRTADLERSLALAGDAPVQLLLIPSSVARRALDEIAPMLPAQIGGGPISILTRGVQCGAAGLIVSPEPALIVTILSQDGAAARSLADWISAALRLVQNNGSPPGLTRAITPTLSTDRLTLSLDAAALRRTIDELMPSIVSARTSARQMVVAAQMRQVLMGCTVYANEHKNEWPPNLDELVKAKYINAETLANPNPRRQGFAYMRPTVEQFMKNPSHLAVLHEGFDQWPADGLWVGFADGHVQLVISRDEFANFPKGEARP